MSVQELYEELNIIACQWRKKMQQNSIVLRWEWWDGCVWRESEKYVCGIETKYVIIVL